MFRLLTDFNESRNDIVMGLIEDAEGPRALCVGDRVLLHDDGEHEAWGTVRRIHDGLVAAEVDWDTWADAGAYKPQCQFGTVIVANFDVRPPPTSGVHGVRMPPRRPLAGAH
jgi:hypothetical protein